MEGIGGGSSSFVEDAPTLGSKANGAMGGGVSRPKAVDAEQTQAEGQGPRVGRQVNRRRSAYQELICTGRREWSEVPMAG